MKRFHVHVAVSDLEEGIAFYSKVLGAEPTVRKPDYAKWMIDEPCLNFAISSRGGAPGVNHLGFQLDSDDELKAMRTRLADADAALVEERGMSCCYARSDKYWASDPAGVAWEAFRTLGSIPTFDAGASDACCASAREAATNTSACCRPAAGAAAPAKGRAGCCA